MSEPNQPPAKPQTQLPAALRMFKISPDTFDFSKLAIAIADQQVDRALKTIDERPDLKRILLRREKLTGDPQADDKLRQRIKATSDMMMKSAMDTLGNVSSLPPEQQYQKLSKALSDEFAKIDTQKLAEKYITDPKLRDVLIESLAEQVVNRKASLEGGAQIFKDEKYKAFVRDELPQYISEKKDDIRAAAEPFIQGVAGDFIDQNPYAAAVKAVTSLADDGASVDFLKDKAAAQAAGIFTDQAIDWDKLTEVASRELTRSLEDKHFVQAAPLQQRLIVEQSLVKALSKDFDKIFLLDSSTPPAAKDLLVQKISEHTAYKFFPAGKKPEEDAIGLTDAERLGIKIAGMLATPTLIELGRAGYRAAVGTGENAYGESYAESGKRTGLLRILAAPIAGTKSAINTPTRLVYSGGLIARAERYNTVTTQLSQAGVPPELRPAMYEAFAEHVNSGKPISDTLHITNGARFVMDVLKEAPGLAKDTAYVKALFARQIEMRTLFDAAAAGPKKTSGLLTTAVSRYPNQIPADTALEVRKRLLADYAAFETEYAKARLAGTPADEPAVPEQGLLRAEMRRLQIAKETVASKTSDPAKKAEAVSILEGYKPYRVNLTSNNPPQKFTPPSARLGVEVLEDRSAPSSFTKPLDKVRINAPEAPLSVNVAADVSKATRVIGSALLKPSTVKIPPIALDNRSSGGPPPPEPLKGIIDDPLFPQKRPGAKKQDELAADRLELVPEPEELAAKKGIWKLKDPQSGKFYYAKIADPSEVETIRKASRYAAPEGSPVMIAKPLETGGKVPAALAKLYTPNPETPLLITEAVPKGLVMSHYTGSNSQPADLKLLEGKPITAQEMRSIIATLDHMNSQGIIHLDIPNNCEIRRVNGKLEVHIYDFSPDAFGAKGTDSSAFKGGLFDMMRTGLVEWEAADLAPEEIKARLRHNIADPDLPPVSQEAKISAVSEALKKLPTELKGSIITDPKLFADNEKLFEGKKVNPALLKSPIYQKYELTKRLLDTLNAVDIKDARAVEWIVEKVASGQLKPTSPGLKDVMQAAETPRPETVVSQAKKPGDVSPDGLEEMLRSLFDKKPAGSDAQKTPEPPLTFGRSQAEKDEAAEKQKLFEKLFGKKGNKSPTTPQKQALMREAIEKYAAETARISTEFGPKGIIQLDTDRFVVDFDVLALDREGRANLAVYLQQKGIQNLSEVTFITPDQVSKLNLKDQVKLWSQISEVSEFKGVMPEFQALQMEKIIRASEQGLAKNKQMQAFLTGNAQKIADAVKSFEAELKAWPDMTGTPQEIAEKRADLLRRINEAQAKALDIPSATLGFGKLTDDKGYYSRSKQSITISEKLLRENDPRTVINTLSHENGHHFQSYLAENFYEFPKGSIKAMVGELYSNNFITLIKSTVDPMDYMLARDSIEAAKKSGKTAKSHLQAIFHRFDITHDLYTRQPVESLLSGGANAFGEAAERATPAGRLGSLEKSSTAGIVKASARATESTLPSQPKPEELLDKARPGAVRESATPKLTDPKLPLPSVVMDGATLKQRGNIWDDGDDNETVPRAAEEMEKRKAEMGKIRNYGGMLEFVDLSGRIHLARDVPANAEALKAAGYTPSSEPPRTFSADVEPEGKDGKAVLAVQNGPKDVDERLHRAIRSADIPEMNAALEHGADPARASKSHQHKEIALLLMAAQQPDPAAFKALLPRYEKVLTKNPEAVSELFAEVTRRPEYLKMVLDAGYNPLERTQAGIPHFLSDIGYESPKRAGVGPRQSYREGLQMMMDAAVKTSGITAEEVAQLKAQHELIDSAMAARDYARAKGYAMGLSQTWVLAQQIDPSAAPTKPVPGAVIDLLSPLTDPQTAEKTKLVLLNNDAAKITGVRKMVGEFVRHVAMPQYLLDEAAATGKPLTRESLANVNPTLEAKLIPATMKNLLGGRPLTEVAGLSAAYHQRHISFPDAMKPLGLGMEWAPLTTQRVIPVPDMPGYELHCLTTAEQLRTEGAKMQHCMGDRSNYITLGLRGITHVYSIRKQGQERPVATFNGTFTGTHFDLEQIRGMNDLAGDETAKKAYDWFKNALESGKLEISPQFGEIEASKQRKGEVPILREIGFEITPENVQAAFNEFNDLRRRGMEYDPKTNAFSKQSRSNHLVRGVMAGPGGQDVTYRELPVHKWFEISGLRAATLGASPAAATPKAAATPSAYEPSITKKGEKYYSPEQAQKIFDQIKSNPKLPFEVTGQCEVRREAMLMHLLEMGVQPSELGRIAVDPGADAKGKPQSLSGANKLGLQQAAITIQHQQPGADLQQITDALRDKFRTPWSFHTAPTIDVWDNTAGRRVTLVLDPTVNDAGPLPKEQWIAAMEAKEGHLVYEGKLGTTPTIKPGMFSDAQITAAAAHLKSMGVNLGAENPTRQQVQRAINTLKPDQMKALVASFYVAGEGGQPPYDPARTLKFMNLTLPLEGDLHTLNKPGLQAKLEETHAALKFAVDSQQQQKAAIEALQKAPVGQSSAAKPIPFSDVQASVLVHIAANDPAALKDAGLSSTQLKDLATNPTAKLLASLPNPDTLKKTADGFAKEKNLKPAPKGNGIQTLGGVMLMSSTGELIFNWHEVSKDPVKLAESIVGIGGGAGGMIAPVLEARAGRYINANPAAAELRSLGKLAHGAFTITTPLMIKGGIEEIERAGTRETDLVAAKDIIHGTTLTVVGTEALVTGSARLMGLKLAEKLSTRAIPVVGEALLVYDAGMLGGRGITNLAGALGIINIGKDDTTDIFENIERIAAMRKKSAQINSENFSAGKWDKVLVIMDDVPRPREYKQMRDSLILLAKTNPGVDPLVRAIIADPYTPFDPHIMIGDKKLIDLMHAQALDKGKKFDDHKANIDRVNGDIWIGSDYPLNPTIEVEGYNARAGYAEMNDYIRRYDQMVKTHGTDPKTREKLNDFDAVLQRMETHEGRAPADHILKNREQVFAMLPADPTLLKDTKILLDVANAEFSAAVQEAKLDKAADLFARVARKTPDRDKPYEHWVEQAKKQIGYKEDIIPKELTAAQLEVTLRRRQQDMKAIFTKLADEKGRLADPVQESERRRKIVEAHFKENLDKVSTLGLHLREGQESETASEMGRQLYLTNWQQFTATMKLLKTPDGKPLNLSLEKDLGIINQTELAALSSHPKITERTLDGYEITYTPQQALEKGIELKGVYEDPQSDKKYEYTVLGGGYSKDPAHKGGAYIDIRYKEPSGDVVTKRLTYRTQDDRTEILGFDDAVMPHKKDQIPEWLKKLNLPAVRRNASTTNESILPVGASPTAMLGMIFTAEADPKNAPEVQKATQERRDLLVAAEKEKAAAQAKSEEEIRNRRLDGQKRLAQRREIGVKAIADMIKDDPNAVRVSRDGNTGYIYVFPKTDDYKELSKEEEALKKTDSAAYMAVLKQKQPLSFIDRIMCDHQANMVLEYSYRAGKEPTGRRFIANLKDPENLGMLQKLLPADKFRELVPSDKLEKKVELSAKPSTPEPTAEDKAEEMQKLKIKKFEEFRENRIELYPQFIAEMVKANPKAVQITELSGKVHIKITARTGTPSDSHATLNGVQDDLFHKDSKAFLEYTRERSEIALLSRMNTDLSWKHEIFYSELTPNFINSDISQPKTDPKTGLVKTEYWKAYEYVIDPTNPKQVDAMKLILPEENFSELQKTVRKLAEKNLKQTPMDDKKKSSIPQDVKDKAAAALKAGEEAALGQFALSTSEQELSGALLSLSLASTIEGQGALAAVQAQLDAVRRTASANPSATEAAPPPSADMLAALERFKQGEGEATTTGFKPKDKNTDKQRKT